MNIRVTPASFQIKEAPLYVPTCEMAPIHTPGSVQSGTTLLMFWPDTDQFAVPSDNLETLFHAPAATLIGADLARIFRAEESAAFQ